MLYTFIESVNVAYLMIKLIEIHFQMWRKVKREHQLPKAVTLPLPFNHNPDAQPNGGVTLPSAMQRFG